MRYILYDLETSDKLPIGQIINYAFVVVDEDLKVIEQLCGEIRLSRLQLPHPDAIAANRVDPIQLQARAQDSELHAAIRIFNFLSELRAGTSGNITLIGFNSSKFDLGYLRTTLIRNGLNPYYPGVRYGDLLYGVRALYLRDERFAKLMRANPGADNKLSFRLENCARALGLLSGRQVHSSYDDVILTLELVREIRGRYRFDLLAYNAYEGIAYHHRLKDGITVQALEIEYDLSSDRRARAVAHTLLDAGDNAALWINLSRYCEKPGRESVLWLKDGAAAFYVDPNAVVHEPEILDVATKARNELRKLNLRNFFEETTCDIELHIYRLDFDARALLERAIHMNDRAALRASKNRDLQQLYRRFLLANYQFSQGKADQDIWARLKAYAQWRYGGKMQTNKSGEATTYAPSFDDFVKRANQLMNEQSELVQPMNSLLNYFAGSDIFSCCGETILSSESLQLLTQRVPDLRLGLST